jgi:putative protease
MIKDAYERKIRRFRIGGLFALELLKDYNDIQIFASFPLPICNSSAIQELADWRVAKVQGWIELERAALTKLIDKSVLPVEIYRYGRPPLLATRAYISTKGEIKDARNNYFVIQEDHRTHITSLYPKHVFSIPRLPNTADYYDLSNSNWNARDIEAFNFNNDLV